MVNRCLICQKSLEKNDPNEVIAKCGHRFHNDCIQEHVRNAKRSSCPVCRTASALDDILDRKDSPESHGRKSSRADKRRDSSLSSAKTDRTKISEVHEDSDDKMDWFCSECSMGNGEDEDRCQSCGELRRFAPSPSDGHKERMAASPFDDRMISEGHDREAYSGKSDGDQSRMLYIINLPADIACGDNLEDTIRKRIELLTGKKLLEIKCYCELGIGVMILPDNQTKKILVECGVKIALDPKDSNRTISFVETLNITSYIVIQMEKKSVASKDLRLPTSDELTRRWEELHRNDRLVMCEQLASPFQNIYRIISTSLDDLIASLCQPDFTVQRQLARIFPAADCTFFEDLPNTMTPEKLQTILIQALGSPKMSRFSSSLSSSMHIELHQPSSCACIITCGTTARLWSKISLIFADGKPIQKKEHLTFLFVIYPVPKAFDLQKLLSHDDLKGKVSVYKHVGDDLILITSDKKLYDDYIKIGIFRLDHQQTFRIKSYVASQQQEKSDEINEATWYDTEMSKYKPDIMPLLADPEHEIFHRKWNAKVWQEQFEKSRGDGSGPMRRFHMPNAKKTDEGNLLRHQLQVTVMLNTLGTIRKGKYRKGNREIKLNLNENMKTIVYNHKSVLQAKGKLPLPTKMPPFAKTKVYVVKDDCVAAYEALIKKGQNPILLNMASSTSPGGGYRKGDGAQEENLFRRSDYCRSLDVGLDDFIKEPSERFICLLDTRLKPWSPTSTEAKMYPIDEYGCIYTTGLTFFRHSQDVGYEYMDNPLENVSAIAMAAYCDPTLDKNMLSPKYAVGTRKKIENIFAVAYHHGHDSLVLSALGCGAFHNPPDHVAKLFDSVIDQYAGFFESIVFAIIDDHNTGGRHNPTGNYKPFADLLDGKVICPKKSMNIADTMIGPYRVSNDGSAVDQISICTLPPCKYGAQCRGMSDTSHSRQYSHPGVCAREYIHEKCDLKDDVVHMMSFTHRNQCRYGGECQQIDDEKHSRQYDHPSYCLNGGECQNLDEIHLKRYRHVLLCKEGQKCFRYLKNDKQHRLEYRHCKRKCQYGNHCVLIHSKKHMNEYEHPFPPPCFRTPYHCRHYLILSGASDIRKVSTEIQEHCLKYSHICPQGRNCMNQTALHWQKSIHIARQVCRDGDNCSRRTDEDHLSSYTHPGIDDIRPLCKYDERCSDQSNFTHVIKYRHKNRWDNNGVVRFFGLNQDIDFVSNQNLIISRVIQYATAQKWKLLPSNSIPVDVRNWIRTVQPVHRCNPVVFSSIVLHGHVMSRQYMENLKNPKCVAHSIMQHATIRSLPSLKISTVAEKAKEFTSAMVAHMFHKHRIDKEHLAGAGPHAHSHHSSSANVEIIKETEHFLTDTMKKDLDILKHKIQEIARASIELHTKPTGVGYSADKDFGTHKQVFSILGPHLGHYYGDVIIVFKRDILHHPDADITVQAATSYGTGNLFVSHPWLNTNPKTPQERVKLYKSSKLNPSIPGFEDALVLDLLAATSEDLTLKSIDIDLTTIFKRLLAIDSHRAIEAHLPQLIPLDYIDHIYIPQNLYDGLDPHIEKTVRTIFSNRITKTSHRGDPNQPTTASGPKPPTSDREAYQNYVVNQLMEQYKVKLKSNVTRPVCGFAITIPALELSETYTIPLTISQAYSQYSGSRSKRPADSTIHIYWQCIGGDMMLALSNEKIHMNKQPNLRCLICYIGYQTQDSDGQCHEETTYLNIGTPYQHSIFMESKRYLAKSNSFHAGCNLDDYITYCLELNPATGRVILRHAGSNAIYNYEELACDVTKEKLDLLKLEYLQISAGAKSIPIRNLMVCFEKQGHLHPTFDKNFKAKVPTDMASMAASSHQDKSTKDDKIPTGAKGTDRKSLSLTPCPRNINCLDQFGSDSASHNSKYSHPCPFAELCWSKEAHLTHDPHPCSLCPANDKCDKLTDPYHRAEYRHKNLPDYLIPCPHQSKCSDKSSKHRVKYSHGEQVLEKKHSASAKSGEKTDLKKHGGC